MIADFDDALALAQIPNDTLAIAGGGHDVRHLFVERHRADVVGRLQLGAGRHRLRRIVQIPDVDVRGAGATRQQVRLKRVEVERADGARVLLEHADDRCLAADAAAQYALVVVQDDLAVLAAADEQLACTLRRVLGPDELRVARLGCDARLDLQVRARIGQVELQYLQVRVAENKQSAETNDFIYMYLYL